MVNGPREEKKSKIIGESMRSPDDLGCGSRAWHGMEEQLQREVSRLSQELLPLYTMSETRHTWIGWLCGAEPVTLLTPSHMRV